MTKKSNAPILGYNPHSQAEHARTPVLFDDGSSVGGMWRRTSDEGRDTALISLMCWESVLGDDIFTARVAADSSQYGSSSAQESDVDHSTHINTWKI